MNILNKIIYYFICIILFSCTFKNPYDATESKDLISRLNLTTDWAWDIGISTPSLSTVTAPSGESETYLISMPNLISNSDFSISTDPITDWYYSGGTDAAVASKFEVRNDGKMYDNYLYIKLNTNPAEYVYTSFSSTSAYSYTFRFDYKYENSATLIVSMGDTTDDSKDKISLSNDGQINTYCDNIACYRTNTANKIRFGSTVSSSDPIIEVNIDNVALFPSSSHSISKSININGSDKPVINDGTGETFYEGIYKLQLFARVPGASDPEPENNPDANLNIITLTLGSRTKEFQLTSGWKEITLEAQILNDQGYLIISISPTVLTELKKFPGNVYITKPKLYFLPNQSSPN
jgi:hypothetical protein